MFEAKRKFFRIVEIILNIILPPKKNQVMFTSFQGQFNDNPKYILKALKEKYPQCRVVWVISERCHEMQFIPQYVKCVRENTFSYVFEKCRSVVLVDNGAGWYLSESGGSMYDRLKKAGQYNISTWHGTPLKRLGKDSLENPNWSSETLRTTSDLLIAGSRYAENAFTSAFIEKMPTALTGTPRCDILFNRSEEVKNVLKDKLQLPKDKKLLLFAPTYRNNPEDSGVYQMKQIDTEKLFWALKSKFGGEWNMVFRAHNMVLETMNKDKALGDSRIIDGNRYDDMMEYMVACDALLTDYSGALFDNALTDIPCFLFAHDKERYANSERGLYMDIDDLPYDFAQTFDELLDIINRYDYKNNEIRCRDFLEKIGNAEDGLASERIADIIIEKVRRNNPVSPQNL